MSGSLLILGLLAWVIYCIHQDYRAQPAPSPAAAPKRPVAASDDAEWLLLPFQAIATLAGLLWGLIMLAVFLAPLLFVVALVWGALQ